MQFAFLMALLCIQLLIPSKTQARIEHSGTIDHVYAVSPGETPSSVLARYGFKPYNLERLIAASPLPRDYRFSGDERYVVSTNAPKRLTEVRFFDERSDASYVFWHDHARAASEMQVVPLKTHIREISGRVTSSVLASIQSAISSVWVASRFMDAYLFDPRTGLLPKGARFGLQVEEKYWRGQLVKYGEVTRTWLELGGRIADRHFLRLADGGGVYVDESILNRQRPLYSPLSYLRISSPFQMSRYHPVRHRHIAHLGTDFELPAGSPVYAAQNGTVGRLGHDPASGNFIVLDHALGLQTSYAHLRALLVVPGQLVKAGQKIGEVGCTGYCTSPHLHFAVKRFGEWLNPVLAMRSYPRQYEGQVLDQVSQLRKKVARY